MIKYYQGDLANTRKWIYKIHNYKENLFDYEISYLYLLKGVSNLKYDIKKSEQYLLKFLNRDNISNNNKTIANIYLSIIYLNTKKKHKALKLLHKIENNNNKILKETIYKLKKKIKNTN
jgi:lipopolysaccharide biosynthesis regulator YciM